MGFFSRRRRIDETEEQFQSRQKKDILPRELRIISNDSYLIYPSIRLDFFSLNKTIKKGVRNWYRIAAILGFNSLKEYYRKYEYKMENGNPIKWGSVWGTLEWAKIRGKGDKIRSDEEIFKSFKEWLRTPINKNNKMVYPGFIDSVMEYPKEFNKKLKDMIKLRDNFECQLCEEEILASKLYVHHIDYNKQNCSPYNLISLCNSCHAKTNINRTHWKYFFQCLLAKPI